MPLDVPTGQYRIYMRVHNHFTASSRPAVAQSEDTFTLVDEFKEVKKGTYLEMPVELRLEIETTSDWTRVVYKNGIIAQPTFSERKILEGKVNSIDEQKDYTNIDNADKTGKPLRLILLGGFRLNTLKPTLSILKGDIGYTTIKVTDLLQKYLFAKEKNEKTRGITNDLDVHLDLSYSDEERSAMTLSANHLKILKYLHTIRPRSASFDDIARECKLARDVLDLELDYLKQKKYIDTFEQMGLRPRHTDAFITALGIDVVGNPN